MTDDLSGTEEDIGTDAEDMPQWERRRIDKITRQKHEARERAEAAERHAAMLEGRLQALEERIQNAPEPRHAKEPEGLDRYTSVEELKGIQRKILEHQELAMDPDASPEARQEAKAALKGINVPEMLTDITARMVDIRSSEHVGEYRAEREQHDAADGARNALTQHLVSNYGFDAVNKSSDLNRMTASVIQEYIDSGDVTAENAGQDFIIKMAFKEASERMKKNGRGGRGEDPRHSALESGGGSRGAPDLGSLAALKKKGAAGDLRSSRKASKMELDSFLDGLRGRGQI